MPSMKVILLSDLHRIGERGDVIQTKAGYARNWLIPKGYAVQATEANSKWFEHQRRKVEARNADEQESAAAIAGQLEGTEITIAKRVGETETLYGSVTVAEITAALAAEGFEVDRRDVDLQGGIKTLGEHEIKIQLHAKVSAAVKLTVVAEE